ALLLTNTEALYTRLDQACDRCFEAFQDTAADLYPIAWAATRRKIRSRLHQFIQVDLEELSESNFKPMFFEEEIDGTIDELKGELQKVPFHGRIDRIDVSKDKGAASYRVADYKTGRSTKRGPKTETSILRGEYLQLPIYLSLVGPWLQKK